MSCQNPDSSEKDRARELDPAAVGHLRVVRVFLERLAEAQVELGIHRSFEDPRRKLQLGHYLGYFLVGLLNPVAGTLRGMVCASRLSKVQKAVGGSAVSLGSLSEAQNLVDIALLEKIFADVSSRVREQDGDGREDVERREVLEWMAHDGSVFAALPRMSWALSGSGRKGTSKAVRLHLSLDIDSDSPAQATVGPAQVCERGQLVRDLKPGGAYILDRLYGQGYAFFGELEKKGCHYVARMKESAHFDVIEECAISSEDKEAGVTRQARVRLGSGRSRSCPLYLVWLQGVSGETLLLATDLAPGDLSAGDVALLYKRRWQVEYFFRWVKCVLGCGHWMAESENGVTIQIYLTLIGALLLQLQLGRRPSKRVMELFHWYLLGMADEEELTALLSSQLASEERSRERQRARRANQKAGK